MEKKRRGAWSTGQSFKMTSKLLDYIEMRFGISKLCCAKDSCSKPILPGQKVMPRHSRNKRMGRGYYHLECWESLFI